MLLQETLKNTAEKYPEKRAVVHGGRNVSYSSMAKQSAKLAKVFHENGVKEGDRIALFCEKSMEAIISIFGILKAGAIYVPIDPTIPSERLRYILDDCDIKVVVTSQVILEKNSEILENKRLLVLTEGDYNNINNKSIIKWSEMTNMEEPAPDTIVNIIDTEPAYIIYTSGSTGVPKGVVISHQSVNHLMEWYCDEFRISVSDNILNFAPLCFDASISDIFSSVRTGATLVLPPEGMNIFPSLFAQTLIDEKITMFFAPSTLFAIWLPSVKEMGLSYPSLRTVFFGAEVLPAKYAREMQTVFKNAEIVNLYGPTEITDTATFYRVKKIPEDGENIPIGKGYPTIEAFAVNENGEPCGANETGELVIRGANLMKGYWKKPEETRNVLRQNPLHSDYIDLVYYTGDLVTMDEDGNYIYRGRKDRMIKSRGYRIQLEEIEKVLISHKKIKEAAIVGVPDEKLPTDVKIKAFVVSLSGLTKVEIVQHCSDRLPHYMIPNEIIFMKELPRTMTGKIDRVALKQGGG